MSKERLKKADPPTPRLRKDREKISEVEVLKSQLARVLADYDNLKKRAERDAIEGETRATARILGRILPVLDMFYDVQKNINDSGLGMSINTLEETFKQENIVKIKVEKGDKFDEELHEVVETINSENKNDNNKISEIVQAGWMFIDGAVIRHAKVVVFK